MIFVGIDPGFTGAIGWIIVGSTPALVAYDLPLQAGTKKREFDLEMLNHYVYRLTELGEIGVGLENPTTRPGEGAERCKRFGEGIGLLKGLLTAHQIPYTCISPNLWKGRLGLPGKTKPGANKAGAQFLVSHYPQAEELVYGPRGGIKDGRLDALLIAHWMKVDHDKR
jgi:hypothetical protein